MKRLRSRTFRKARNATKQEAVQKASNTGGPWNLPHIEEFIEYGNITVGMLHPVGCVASAADEDCCLAMLKRRKRETLAQFLARLDEAIAKAWDENIFTDEINS